MNDLKIKIIRYKLQYFKDYYDFSQDENFNYKYKKEDSLKHKIELLYKQCDEIEKCIKVTSDTIIVNNLIKLIEKGFDELNLHFEDCTKYDKKDDVTDLYDLYDNDKDDEIKKYINDLIKEYNDLLDVCLMYKHIYTNFMYDK